jgi:arylsulfatase A-like enzyme
MKFWLLCFLALPVVLSAAPPNIVFFLIDDLGYADCGFNGGTEIKTPNIDRLAREGAVLEHHYVQPVCSPTRSAFMTGRYPTRTGVYSVVRPHAPWGLALEERTLASALKEAGYSTAIVGKWHLGEFKPDYLPMARGFDHQHGMYFGAIDHNTHLRDDTHDWHHDDKELKEEGYSTHLLTREACRLVAAQDKAKPLFLYVPYNAVHSPHQVPESYTVPYGQLQGARKTLAGMLAAVDEGIGEVVKALEKAGLRENTLILFSSDNGGPRPGVNTPLKDYKGSIYEGGIRAAALANWPGKIPAGQRIKQPMHIVDWYPTLIKLAGGTLEQKLPLDGLDVWPMLTESKPSPHEAILCAKSETSAALRVGGWKLLQHPHTAGKKKGKAKTAGPPKHELFHLDQDPGESRDLSAQEPERLSAMRATLADLLKNAVPSALRNAP